MTTKTRMFSARLRPETADRLALRGASSGVSKSALAERYIDEGMRMDDHPGIVFRPGPTGRRAALISGPDVWEVVSVLKSGDDSGAAAVRGAAEHMNVSERAVRVAVRYYAAFDEEINALIRSKLEESEAAEAQWLREQALLG